MLIMIARGKIQLDDDARKAREIIDSGTNGHLRNKAGNEIANKIIPWKMIEDKNR